MPKLWAKRGVGRRGVTPLIPPRWLRVLPPALMGWSECSPVGYSLTGSDGRAGTRGPGSGRNTAVGSGGGAAPCEASVAPPSLFLPVEAPVELAFAADAEAGEDSQRPDGGSVSATRQRVVLLPHAPDRAPDTDLQRRAEGLQA
jgi:hypothetical protein